MIFNCTWVQFQRVDGRGGRVFYTACTTSGVRVYEYITISYATIQLTPTEPEVHLNRENIPPNLSNMMLERVERAQNLAQTKEQICDPGCPWVPE